ncbi:unnamed protein product [Rhodiola kirilowii]
MNLGTLLLEEAPMVKPKKATAGPGEEVAGDEYDADGDASVKDQTIPDYCCLLE